MSKTLPIILLGTERSGTNLLRALLSTHSDIASPPPCGMLDTLAGNNFKYLSPLYSSHMSELIEDVLTLTKTHMNPWDVKLQNDMIMKRLDPHSFWNLFKVINEIYAEEHKCSNWFSKEPGAFNYISELKLHIPNVKFIYMIRDGRDVAASMLKGKQHEFHIYNVAKRWAHEQRLCLNAYSDPLLNSQIFMVRYEDLIDDTESVLIDLMGFLGLNFEKEQLNFYKNDAVVKHSKKSKFWKNLSRPIDKSKKSGYLRELSTKKIEIFESIAWNEMKALGYQLECSDRKNISLVSRGIYILSAHLRRKLSQFSSNSDEARRRLVRSKLTGKMRSRTFE